ncbi:MAG: TolC family protein [Candidatus Kapabacteria bacterium]|nr:TolC family protein [Ignavibacteriota bacterium]MCW5884486.1 TolC family protein [Candidatus Kapabacteria bacterium]
MKKIVLLLVIISFGNLTAQQGVRKTYTLQECLDIATRMNFDVILSEAQVATSGADITQAFGAYLPQIDFNMGYQRILNPEGQRSVNVGGVIIETPGTNPNSYFMNAGAGISIFDGFAREANYSRAQDQLSANQLSLDQTIQQVRFTVYLQYVDVIRNSQLVKIRKENFNQGRQELDRIRAQYDAGFIPVNVVYSQEAELGNREIEIIDAENRLNISKTTLMSTMGINPDFESEFLESSLPTTIDPLDIEIFRRRTGTLQSAMKIALENRSDLKASELALEASKSQITIANSGYIPQISASGGWRWNHFEFEKFSEFGRAFAGLSLSMPIFDNFRTNLQIQNAKLQVSQAEIQKQRIELAIKQAVQNSLLNLEAAEKQLEISERSLKASEKNFEVTSERFRQGAANITDYTLANMQFITSQINRITAVYNYLAAMREVEFATGNMR